MVFLKEICRIQVSKLKLWWETEKNSCHVSMYAKLSELKLTLLVLVTKSYHTKTISPVSRRNIPLLCPALLSYAVPTIFWGILRGISCLFELELFHQFFDRIYIYPLFWPSFWAITIWEVFWEMYCLLLFSCLEVF